MYNHKRIAVWLAITALTVFCMGAAEAQTPVRKWLLEPDLSIGAVKIVQNAEHNGVSGEVFSMAGIGVGYNRLEWNVEKATWDLYYGFAFDLFVGGSLDGQFNVSPVGKVSFFDGWIQVGVGYDLGYVGDRSRTFGLFSTNFGGALQ